MILQNYAQIAAYTNETNRKKGTNLKCRIKPASVRITMDTYLKAGGEHE